MNELPRDRDDEIVSAFLDGEATADERARVDADPDLQRRVAEMRQVRDAVASPVVPLDDLSARRLVDRALGAASSEGANPAPAGPGSGGPSRRRQRGGTLIGLGSAAAVVILALLVGPMLSLGGDDDSGEFATVGGELDDAESDALNDGWTLQHEEADAAADDGGAPGNAGPPFEASNGDRAGTDGPDRSWLGTYESFDDLLAELEVVVGRPVLSMLPSTASGYGGIVAECPEPDGDEEWSEALVEPFALFNAVVAGRAVVVVVANDDTGEPTFVLLDLATCELIEPG